MCPIIVVIITPVSGDFGIAKNLDNALDVANTCVGTPCYLSPEMCQDIPYSSKADIWVRQSLKGLVCFCGLLMNNRHTVCSIIEHVCLHSLSTVSE